VERRLDESIESEGREAGEDPEAPGPRGYHERQVGGRQDRISIEALPARGG